ncbi:hypothetical protein CSB93_2050 [Pseudomonas paraeruginosa]|uniref:Uncharacterized protein n=1 Tax=Pseudomonas paraeruginosa TaxID=2994495 RepID=A0A2R3J0U5_9PSED|nr:hypothetical protein CSB93_2050 [Pseudomonas paraeruginosa]AWE92697.1 hypothetical protein CSC28_0817 [Pseudomonas paraeruginosa]
MKSTPWLIVSSVLGKGHDLLDVGKTALKSRVFAWLGGS